MIVIFYEFQVVFTVSFFVGNPLVSECMNINEKLYIQQAFRTLRTRLLFQLWTFSLYIHCKTKTNKKFADFIKKNWRILKFYWNSNFVGGEFLKFWLFINLPWSHVRYHKIMCRIGSAVSTFIGHKQTNKHPKNTPDSI